MRFVVSHDGTFVKANNDWKWYENRTTSIVIWSDVQYEELVNKLFGNLNVDRMQFQIQLKIKVLNTNIPCRCSRWRGSAMVHFYSHKNSLLHSCESIEGWRAWGKYRSWPFIIGRKCIVWAWTIRVGPFITLVSHLLACLLVQAFSLRFQFCLDLLSLFDMLSRSNSSKQRYRVFIPLFLTDSPSTLRIILKTQKQNKISTEHDLKVWNSYQLYNN